MRILLLSPNTIKSFNWGHQLFRDAIGKCCEVVYYGKGYGSKRPSVEKSLPKIIEKFGPFDAVVSYDGKYCGLYTGWKEVKIPKVCILVDYLPRNANHPHLNKFITSCDFDLVALRAPLSVEVFIEEQKAGRVPANTKPLLLLFGADYTNYYENAPRDIVRNVDVCSVMSTVSWAYPKRVGLLHLVRTLNTYPSIKTVAGGDGRKNRIVHKKYVELLWKSRIFIISNGVYKCVTMKYYEAMICGCLLMTDKPRDSEAYGFIDGENIVYYEDYKRDGMEKIFYFLLNKNEMQKIALKAQSTVLSNSLMTDRAKELIAAIKEI